MEKGVVAHQRGLLGHKEVAGGVVVRAGLARGPLPEVEGVCKHGQREGQPAQLAHGILREAIPLQRRSQNQQERPDSS